MKGLLAVGCSALFSLGAEDALASASPLHVWYRGAEGCPDGSAFVHRLSELGREAQLASVGDPVDFVVSVSTTAGVSRGRLERQTREGQMAIRELEAPRCEQVTEGLALSLDLALDPSVAPADGGAHGIGLVLGGQGTLVTGIAPEARSWPAIVSTCSRTRATYGTATSIARVRLTPIVRRASPGRRARAPAPIGQPRMRASPSFELAWLRSTPSFASMQSPARRSCRFRQRTVLPSSRRAAARGDASPSEWLPSESRRSRGAGSAGFGDLRG